MSLFMQQNNYLEGKKAPDDKSTILIYENIWRQSKYTNVKCKDGEP